MSAAEGPFCPFCGDGPEAIGTMYHIECVEKLMARIAELEAQLAALKARRCDDCEHCMNNNECFFGIQPDVDSDRVLPDFACNRWAERGTK